MRISWSASGAPEKRPNKSAKTRLGQEPTSPARSGAPDHERGLWFLLREMVCQHSFRIGKHLINYLSVSLGAYASGEH
jgi:hypothetical protein